MWCVEEGRYVPLSISGCTTIALSTHIIMLACIFLLVCVLCVLCVCRTHINIRNPYNFIPFEWFFFPRDVADSVTVEWAVCNDLDWTYVVWNVREFKQLYIYIFFLFVHFRFLSSIPFLLWLWCAEYTGKGEGQWHRERVCGGDEYVYMHGIVVFTFDNRCIFLFSVHFNRVESMNYDLVDSVNAVAVHHCALPSDLCEWEEICRFYEIMSCYVIE